MGAIWPVPCHGDGDTAREQGRMQRYLLSFALAFSLVAAGARAADGDLKGWRDIPFGTPLTDFQKAYPCNRAQPGASETTCRLAGPVKIRNLNFDATFGFDDVGLVWAMLTLLPVSSDQSGQVTEQVYALLCLDAARKYGEPSLQISPEMGRDRVGGSIWKFPGGSYLSIALEGQKARQLTLVYHSAAHLPADP